MADVVNSVVINYKSVGLDKVGADLKQTSTAIDGLVVSSATAFKATTELENKFKGLQKSTTAYTTALGEARGAAMGLAAGIGPLGAVLGSFGPWGIAAAAGIGLVTSAFTYLKDSADRMGDEAVKLKQFSDVSGLTTAQVRGLSEAGQELGVGAEAITGALSKFTVNLDAARKGSGDLYEQLRDIDKQLAIQIGATRSTSEALDLLAKAYSATADATTKAALSRAAFGKGGVSVGPVLGLLGEGGGVEAYSKAATEALGVTDDWTKSVAKLRNENKDLADDIKTIEGALHAQETLKIENELLKQRLEIIKATRDAVNRGGQPTMLGDFGTGNVVPFATSQAAVTGEAGRGGMVRDTEAATRALEENERALRDNDIAMKEVAAQSQILVSALGAGATAAEKEAARVDALTAAFLANKFGVRESAEAIDVYHRAVAANPAVLGAEKATQQMERQNELAKARNLSDEKWIASQQAYNQVIKEIGDTEAGRAAANARSSAVEESYRIKISDKTREAASHARELQNAFNDTVFSAQAVANATEIMAENTARAAKTAADLAYVTQNGIFAPNVMPTGQHSFVADPRYPVSYRGGGTGKRLDTGAEMAVIGQFFVEQKEKADAELKAAEDLKQSMDKLATSTDDLNRTNQELLSPYYTQDPRTSHIGFRSQGMAGGGYVDVPGGASANDNMLAMVPVASGERIYVDPMTSRRGGGGAAISISMPMTFTGNVNPDQVGRTVFQTMQNAARQIQAANR